MRLISLPEEIPAPAAGRGVGKRALIEQLRIHNAFARQVFDNKLDELHLVRCRGASI